MRVRLCQAVADLVTEHGSADVNDLSAWLPQYSRTQLLDAMKTARKLGLIHCVEPRKAGGAGWIPGRYHPGPMPDVMAAESAPPKDRVIAIRPPNSAWELAHCLQIAGSWPPAWEGGRVYGIEQEEEETACP